jgi:hypothetical protein
MRHGKNVENGKSGTTPYNFVQKWGLIRHAQVGFVLFASGCKHCAPHCIHLSDNGGSATDEGIRH